MCRATSTDVVARALLRALVVAGAAALAACQGPTLTAFPEQYGGVGVELTLEAAGARVVRVAPGGAADKAGLSTDDVLLAVGPTETRGKELAEVVAALRGAPGSNVDVLVRTRAGERTLTLTRQQIAQGASGYRAP